MIKDLTISPDDLRILAKTIEDLRREMLCMDDSEITPEAEQLFLLALAAMDQARSYIKLAEYRLMKHS